MLIFPRTILTMLTFPVSVLKLLIFSGHKWVIFFPEGGFLKNRGESARNYARKNGLPVLYNCCLPRATAFVNIIR